MFCDVFFLIFTLSHAPLSNRTHIINFMYDTNYEKWSRSTESTTVISIFRVLVAGQAKKTRQNKSKIRSGCR